jgi:hypothetical protein
MAKGYFDKFIDDQLKRAGKIKEEREARHIPPEQDTKRNMINHYRERIKNLVRYNRKK